MGTQTRSSTKSRSPPAYTHHPQFAGKSLPGWGPKKRTSVKREPDTSIDTLTTDDTEDGEAESDDVGAGDAVSEPETQRNSRADSKIPNYFEACAEKDLNTQNEQRKSGRVRKPTKLLHDSMLSETSYLDEDSDDEERQDEEMVPWMEDGEMEDHAIEDNWIGKEPIARFFLVAFGHQRLPRDGQGEETLSYQTQDLVLTPDCADTAAFVILDEIMAKPEWSGDYTVWMSPLSGVEKHKRIMFIHSKDEGSKSAKSKLEKLELSRSDYCTMVYLTSMDESIRWFIKVTPFESRFCVDKNDG